MALAAINKHNTSKELNSQQIPSETLKVRRAKNILHLAKFTDYAFSNHVKLDHLISVSRVFPCQFPEQPLPTPTTSHRPRPPSAGQTRCLLRSFQQSEDPCSVIPSPHPKYQGLSYAPGFSNHEHPWGSSDRDTGMYSPSKLAKCAHFDLHNIHHLQRNRGVINEVPIASERRSVLGKY